MALRMFDIARPTDRAGVIGVINQVASERWSLHTAQYMPTPEWEALFREGYNANEGCLLLVAFKEGDRQQLVGFGRIITEAAYRSIGDVGLALLPPYRSRGIGTQLLQELILWAPRLNLHLLRATVLQRNTQSQRLFEKCGFRVTTRQWITLPYQNPPVEELLFTLDCQEAACITIPPPQSSLTERSIERS